MSETLTTEDVRSVMRHEIVLAGGTHVWAARHHVPRRAVWDVRSGADPSDAVLDALGLVRVVTYRRRR